VHGGAWQALPAPAAETTTQQIAFAPLSAQPALFAHWMPPSTTMTPLLLPLPLLPLPLLLLLAPPLLPLLLAVLSDPASLPPGPVLSLELHATAAEHHAAKKTMTFLI
jgi:hypothetical protein